MSELAVETTAIPGLLVVRMPVHGDARGWFKENWQREKMTALGLPDFGPVQNNISFNAHRGATRGIHTEPWDKYVSVATGRVFAAWVDMRAGDSFGATFWIEIDPSIAVFVPRGVGNSYQALDDGTAYTYLVNEHWRPGIAYPALHLADESASIPWPIPLDSAEVEISEKDHRNPRLGEVEPVAARKVLITGANGQLGRALAAAFPEADAVSRDQLDITDAEAVAGWNWTDYGVILNAAAWTAVDAAETDRAGAWQANASAPAQLAEIARRHQITLVHYSTDYVFDGTEPVHTEAEPVAPLGVYGQSKAAGEIAVAQAPRHYLLRTTWVVGEGGNFVRTMAGLAERGISPSVVADQFGRLTFAAELARATRHLLDTAAAYGTYNVTNGGPETTWAQVARSVFAASGRSADDVTETTTAEYTAGQGDKVIAPRPRHSLLDLSKLEATGFTPEPAEVALARYLEQG